MDEFLPAEVTQTFDEIVESAYQKTYRIRGGESAVSPRARLDFEWNARMTFKYPETWTQAEAKDAFLTLSADLARTQCFLIIQALPSSVVPIILPQLQEMAEYEVRMSRLCQELEGPDIRERWVSLPITV